LKITPNNVKLAKLWFFIKFLNFSKNSEILNQAKTSYYTAPRKVSEFFDNPIENYELFLHKTNKKILIKSWHRAHPSLCIASAIAMLDRDEHVKCMGKLTKGKFYTQSASKV